MNNLKKGFTLVEIMVVVGLIAILLVLTITGAKKHKAMSRNNIRVSDIKLMRLALEDYKLSCGQYPPRFELSAHSNSGPCDAASGVTLGDFINKIPVNPNNEDSHFGSYITSSGIDDSNGYMYAGLSSSAGGKCYDYHIAAELELTSENMSILDTDHDAKKGAGRFRYSCGGSNPDFGQDTDEDDSKGLYDFRSSNNV